MNTAQLTILWYAGIAIIGILSNYAIERSSVSPLLPAIAILAALLIYTLRPHINARKGVLLFLILLPFTVISVGWVSWHGYHSYRDIALSQIRLEGMSLKQQTSGKLIISNEHYNKIERLRNEPGSLSSVQREALIELERRMLRLPIREQADQLFTLTGHLKNTSEYPLISILMEIQLNDGAHVICNDIAVIRLTVPPGETREFKAPVIFSHCPHKPAYWNHDVLKTQGAPERGDILYYLRASSSEQTFAARQG